MTPKAPRQLLQGTLGCSSSDAPVAHGHSICIPPADLSDLQVETGSLYPASTVSARPREASWNIRLGNVPVLHADAEPKELSSSAAVGAFAAIGSSWQNGGTHARIPPNSLADRREPRTTS